MSSDYTSSFGLFHARQANEKFSDLEARSKAVRFLILERLLWEYRVADEEKLGKHILMQLLHAAVVQAERCGVINHQSFSLWENDIFEADRAGENHRGRSIYERLEKHLEDCRKYKCVPTHPAIQNFKDSITKGIGGKK